MVVLWRSLSKSSSIPYSLFMRFGIVLISQVSKIRSKYIRLKYIQNVANDESLRKAHKGFVLRQFANVVELNY